MAQRRSRGTIEPRGETKWLLRVYVGKDAKGKRKYQSQTFEGTYRQAERELTKLVTKKDEKRLVVTPKTTVGGFLDQYLDAKKDKVSPKTMLTYRNIIKNHVRPYFEATRLDSLTPLQVQLWVTKLSETCGTRTVQFAYTMLAQAMRQAVSWDILVKSPCRGVNLPRSEKKTLEVLTPDQVRKFLEVAKQFDDYALWVVAFTTGMRPEEYLALTWDVIDFENATIRVEKALNEQEDYSYVIGKVKTPSSLRTLTVPKATIEALKAHRTRQVAEMLKAGERYERNNLVFARKDGRIAHQSSQRWRWEARLKAAGLQKVKLYATRHTHATQLIDAGVPIKAVSERLGHKSVQTTMDIYVHTTEETHRQTASVVDTLLFRTAANG